MKKSFENKKALLVDDSPTIRQIVKSQLKQMGFNEDNIKDAKDGRFALKILDDMKFDLIICDWNMPNMDGLSLLKVVKERESLKGTPFVMLTSETDEKKKMEVFESGVDQYITKPFEPATLQKTVENLLRESVTFADKRALIIDDSKPMRLILIKNLKQSGFNENNITAAVDGEEALEKLCDEKVDLIVSDWHMPKMSGLEFLARTRKNDALKNIPFLMVSSENQKEKIMEAIKEGVSGYIIKPFNAIDLQAKIKSIFEIAMLGR